MSHGKDERPGPVVVLGGSSPFTVGLIEALARGRATPRRLVLQGRNEDDLTAVWRYASHRLRDLGWTVDRRSSATRALEGAAVVVHQNRYGGTAARIADEAFALALNEVPDETLGVAAVRSVLRSAPEIRESGRRIAGVSPRAWVINLTNPLSVATSLLAESGVTRCLGVCELPVLTARTAARIVGADWEEVEWSYTGLNHRGFITQLTAGGRDLIGSLASLPPSTKVAGTTVAAIRATGGIPTKYFELLRARPAQVAGRAARVERIRERALRELKARPETHPRPLRARRMEWYPLVVVPLLSALAADLAEDHVVDVPDVDGVTREVRARVCRKGVEIRPHAAPAPCARSWLERFEFHELALLAAVRDPSAASIERALALDPLMRGSDRRAVAAKLVDELG